MVTLINEGLGVIHPIHSYSPKKLKELPVDLKVESSPARLNQREPHIPVLDTHLSTSPIKQQTAATELTTKRSTSTISKRKPTRDKSTSGKKQVVDKRSKRVKSGKIVVEKIFGVVRKKQIEKPKKTDTVKKPQTISELYKDISLKSHIVRLYIEVMKYPAEKAPDKIYIKDFMTFIKHIAPDVYENEVKDAFYYLAKSNEEFILPDELGKKYDAFKAEEENLKGMLSVGTLKARRYELHKKVADWNKNYPQQKAIYNNYENKCGLILNKLKALLEEIMLEKPELNKRIKAFEDFQEERRQCMWKLKTLIQIINSISPSSNLSLKDLKRHIENKNIRKLAEFSLLRSFIEQIKKRCVLDGNNFSFYDVPDVILSLKYGKTEYNLIIQFTKKLKDEYLEMKKALGKEGELNEEDIVPLTLLDETFTRIRYKQERTERYMNNLLSDSETEVNEKKADLHATKQRVIEIIEGNIIVNYLNMRLDNLHTNMKLSLFIINQLYTWINDRSFTLRGNEFFIKFDKLLSTTKDDTEFKKLNLNELEKISNSDERVDKPIEDELEDTINVLNRPGDKGVEEFANRFGKKLPLTTINEQPIKENLLSQRGQEEKKEEHFLDSRGKKYNPKEKFGTLEKDYIEYDPHMTKYEAVLPEDFYMKTIDKQSPEKKDKWFVRPHHVETLTRHPYSKWDHVLNTKYYSYYHEEKKDKGKKEDRIRRLGSDVIDSLEEQIIKLKARIYLKEQLKEHKKELGMNGRSLSLKSRKDKNVLGKIEESVEEIRK